jgi:hypothetical protein
MLAYKEPRENQMNASETGVDPDLREINERSE